MSGFSASRPIKKEDSAPLGDANDRYKSDEDALADARGYQAARKYPSSIECYGIYFRRIGYHTTIKPGSRTAKSLLIALHGISTAYYEFANTELDSGKTVDHAAIKQHIEDALYWAIEYNNRQKKQHKHFDLLQIKSLFERLESKSAVVPEQEKDYKPITPATSLDTGMPIDAVIDRKLREIFEVLAEDGVPESERAAFIIKRVSELLHTGTRELNLYFLSSIDKIIEPLNEQSAISQYKSISPALYASIDESTLSRLQYRYTQRLNALRIPEGGFQTREQANAAARLSKNYAALSQLQLKSGIEPWPKTDKLREAERLRMVFERQEKSKLSPQPKRPRGRPPAGKSASQNKR